MSKWVAVVFEDDLSDGRTDAWILEADSEEQAAELAATWFQDVCIDNNEGWVEHVFVAPWDGRVAYQPTRLRVERAELQCCGGPASGYAGAAGHYAFCEMRPLGTGHPREGEDEPTG